MRVTFVQYGFETLGIEYLSATLKRTGHETTLVFDPALFGEAFWFPDSRLARWTGLGPEVLAERIVATRPQLVAFSVLTMTYRWARDIAEAVRARSSVPIVFGGVHATVAPEECMRHPFIDYTVVGEGDHAIVDLANALEGGGDTTAIPNVWARAADDSVIANAPRPLVADLDALPFPDKDLFAREVRLADMHTAMTGRGCPFSCTFCNNTSFQGLYEVRAKYHRRQSPERTLAELEEARDRYGIKRIYFHDDVFTQDYDWLRDFLPRYAERVGIPFRCISHPLLMSDEIARLLKDASCYLINFGIQDLNAETRKEMLSRREKNERIETALEVCDRHDLAYDVDHIGGLPGQTEADLAEAARFYAKARKLRWINFTYLSYLPGTPIVDIGKQLGHLSPAQIEAERRGEGNLMHHGGTFEPAVQQRLDLFRLVFALLALLPRPVASWLGDHDRYMKLGALPRSLGVVLGLFARAADYQTWVFARFYALHLGRRLVPGRSRAARALRASPAPA